MTEILTAAQMRAIELAAIESGEVTGLELMERAGRGVVDAIFDAWPDFKTARGPAPEPPKYFWQDEDAYKAIVLCGPGNNGGDGFVVARLLRDAGWVVEVFLYGDAGQLPPDAKTNYQRWSEIGAIRAFADISEEILNGASLTIDAIFGTGLTRPLPDEIGNVLQFVSVQANSRSKVRPPIVAVDVPSGIDADSGRPISHSVIENDEGYYTPALTVTFGAAKVGHFLDTCTSDYSCNSVSDRRGPSLVVKPIGVEHRIEVAAGNSRIVDLFEPDKARHIDLLGRSSVGLNLLFLSKDRGGHKFSHGHALVLTGGFGKTGAARLAARGALRVGAGLVTLGVPPNAQMEVASQIAGLMMTRVQGGEALAETLTDARLNAVCVGPGFGHERARALVPVVLSNKRATVLDADALSAFANAPEELFETLHENCILTPHKGEFARLFPDLANRLAEVPTRGPAYSKVDATREAAARAGCVVLFKGPDTVIAAPDGKCSINSAHYERSAPWLATAGSGDVLAGFITGLLARGFSAMDAAETGAWLHVECAIAFGPGLIAEDLPEILPKVFCELGL
ncbi:NAD(P)H-hydrate dehydratase [Shimia abyssi]|uniref:Bifunctional NAD(P)H-hydrate repair enzyme n=1 Tax=Shimia abyssi TaxID=1662395 RepID=A0A2P8FIW6_9RHOB|nr:NAD(P)H-hydrate dehydratase [Shimia abyssi]PSL21648.1 hydroxyethylthiazole kinase-like uncharacterized protein yjeF/hydroxyethylthiazole kinase-like uncharacterized protein yjeF [Shimia abyssi]